ncbi:hypothetical protein G3R49_19245 [Shewanella sp. WXL01]|uniref:hypothetical protein n=1 Tax=Shewanella sp. WXL01 TaxID=2709721 RepID=UPI0014382D3A|nr:hypothetical protein [Shewanella sp. WXL01]NKF52695.1 hypothetical protein [Shewanella sp. WXL01]
MYNPRATYEAMLGRPIEDDEWEVFLSHQNEIAKKQSEAGTKAHEVIFATQEEKLKEAEAEHLEINKEFYKRLEERNALAEKEEAELEAMREARYAETMAEHAELSKQASEEYWANRERERAESHKRYVEAQEREQAAKEKAKEEAVKIAEHRRKHGIKTGTEKAAYAANADKRLKWEQRFDENWHYAGVELFTWKSEEPFPLCPHNIDNYKNVEWEQRVSDALNKLKNMEVNNEFN